MSERKQQSGSRNILVWITGALLVGVGLLAFVFLSSQSDLEARVAALRKAGMPMNGEELNDFYVVPADVPDSTLEWQAACELVRSKTFADAVSGLPILGQGEDIPPPGETWEQFEQSKTAIESTIDTELAAVRKAVAAGGRARFQVDFRNGMDTLLTDTQEMRTHARLLALDANIAAHEGDAQRVIDDIRGMLAVSEAMAEEPMVISHLVRMAIVSMAIDQAQKLLPHCECTDSQLARLQAAMFQIDLRRGLRRGYIGERAIGLDFIGELSTPFAASNQHEALDVYEEGIESHEMSWKETREWQNKVDTELQNLSGGFISRIRYRGVLMALPALAQVSTATFRTEADQRCMVIALGAMRQKLRDGEYPRSMPDANLLPNADIVTKDPFSDQPMLVKTHDGNTTFYSIGENETDDGGSVEPEKGRALDVGFRVPSQHGN